MRKTIYLLYFLINLQTAFAQAKYNQNKRADSLDALHAITSNPMEKFKALSAYAENIGLHSGQLDSATCIQMLQIAQQLHNDSLLAISYNL